MPLCLAFRSINPVKVSRQGIYIVTTKPATMKKVMACITTVFMLVAFTPSQANAETNPVPLSATEKESAELKALINRIHEINAMDRSTMSRAERKEIRKELREIKKEVKRHGGGGAVYISGSLLVVILILIIVF
jgi:hypothetical protein